MVETGLWQETSLQELTSLLQPDQDVLALAAFGSSAGSRLGQDSWSDIDVLIVISDGAESRFYPTLDWLQPIGVLYTHEQTSNDHVATTRVCFQDLRRIDVLITTETQLTQIREWPRVPFWTGVRVLFSRSRQIEELLSGPFATPEPSPVSAEAFERMVHDFWFKAVVAVNKTVRDDLLIALHLALDLLRDCCVLQMALRDRAEGTNVHREGGIGNQLVGQLGKTQQSHTALGILSMIDQSARLFDDLALQLSDTYQEKREPLLAWLQLARETVAARNQSLG